ncbi:MAG TPA: hypothetical protein VIX35_08830 [Vicinamibacterales bacterium]
MSSVEWAIMRAPERAYSRLTAVEEPLTAAVALRRVVVAALLIGATMATTATSVADAVVVLRTTLAWSFAVAVQVAGALVLVATAGRRRAPAPQAFDLLFAANGPWSLWLIGFTAWTALTSPLGRPLHGAITTLAIPGVWTAYLVLAYCQVVLGETRRVAFWKMAAHQSAMWIVGAGYFFWAVQGWPRLIAWWAWRAGWAGGAGTS